MDPIEPEGPRLLDAMPRTLLVVFLAVGLTGVVVALLLLVRPPRFETVPLQARRPPPAGPYAHDPIRVHPVVLPREAAPFTAPCAAVEGVEVQAGILGVGRIRSALRHACQLAGPAVSADLNEAIGGLRRARVRFAAFDRSGAESTVEVPARTIWLNVKLSERELPVTHVVPVLLHDALHLARAGRTVTAAQELAARRVEAEVCRQIVPLTDSPRWCEDARAIAGLPEGRALDLLARAGFPR